MSDWKTAGNSGDGTVWDLEKPVQGIYVRNKTNVGPHDSNVYSLQVDGQEVEVWGSTVLDSKFSEITIGQEVRIEFLGQAKGKTGTSYKDFKVEYRDATTSTTDAGIKQTVDAIFPEA